MKYRSKKEKKVLHNMIVNDYLTGKYTVKEIGGKYSLCQSTVSNIITTFFKRTSRFYASNSR